MYSFEGLNQGFTKGQLVAGCILGQCLMVGVMYLGAKVTGVVMGLGQAGLISLATTGVGVLCGVLYFGARGITRALIWLVCQGVSVWIVKTVLGIVLTKAALIWGICYLSSLGILGVIVAFGTLIVSQIGNNVYNDRLFDLKQRSSFNL